MSDDTLVNEPGPDGPGPEAAADPADLSDNDQTDETGTTGTLDVNKFLWAHTMAGSQLETVVNIPVADLDQDTDGRRRLADLYDQLLARARDAVPANTFDQLIELSPPLPEDRPPSAVELRSALTGVVAWANHVHGQVKAFLASQSKGGGKPGQPGPALQRIAAAAGHVPADADETIPAGHYL